MTAEQNPQQETFIAHLVELRGRLLRAVLSVLIIFFCLFYWANDIYNFLSRPLLDALPSGSGMISVGIATNFFVPVKVTLMVSFLIALPYVLWQLWAFIAPGLYQSEKKLVLPVVVSSVVLFFTGMAFAYFVVFPFVFKFLMGIAPDAITPMPDIETYWSFVLTLFLAFGVAFETPVVVVVLATMGVVPLEKLKQSRPYVIVGAFVIAAIFTPPDVLSQLFLAIPLCLLYEFGLILARLMIGNKKKAEAAAEAEETQA
jgi:sec-independent protein translocase protein TatC